jgi:hypothetical protein
MGLLDSEEVLIRESRVDRDRSWYQLLWYTRGRGTHITTNGDTHNP